ncbi:MAG: DNA mismatch repair protein MutS [Phycisphaerales bacterium]
MPAATSDPRDTPAMRQYYRFKREYPGCVLLFRIGDFYEMFDDDAVAVSRAIGLTLTQRTEGVPMAGMPYHQLEVYLRRLLDAGFRVAVAEQLQEAAQAKAQGGAAAVIQRGVTRVMTPGTLIDDALLSDESPSALACVFFADAGEAPTARVALAVADLSTGSFTVLDATAESLIDELARRSVSELVYSDTADGKRPHRVARVLDALSIAGTPQPSWHFRVDESCEALHEQFGVTTLAGFGLDDDEPVVCAAGALVRYFKQTQTPASDESISPRAGRRVPTLRHLRPPAREPAVGWCMIDATTLRSLEVLRTIRGGRLSAATASTAPADDLDGSLVSIFLSRGPGSVACRTAMGKRLLRDWLCRPSGDRGVIGARQTAVASLVEDRTTAGALRTAIDGVQDVARIAARLSLGRLTPRDLVALGKSLSRVQALAHATTDCPALASHAGAVASLVQHLVPLADRIARACVDSPPAHLRDGGLIRDGIDPELDEARSLRRDAGAWLAEYQSRLVAEHSLSGIKVGYNKVFGYFIELTKAQARAAPASFTRRQTLTSAERYITPELKDFEEKVTTAESRSIAREQSLFDDLCDAATRCVPSITRFGEVVAQLDALLCFADKAVTRRWVRPDIVDEPVLDIAQGRHPVLDELLANNFVPNDVHLDAASHPARDAADPDPASSPPSLALITGPNMAGKSTFIRQTALLVLLAHAGSFIPADRATIGLTDRIFTRIGADDALHAGQSTFMVEMTETARILHHASPRSLVVLDEIGRGTSTLDGLSLAWAIAELLALRLGPRTLFATHYHELTDLEDQHPGRIGNLHVAVREWGDQIVFLHRILPGRTDQSYGIHVAKLAGLPDTTVARAREVLESLAVEHTRARRPSPGPSPASGAGRNSPAPSAPADGQLLLFTQYLPHPAVEALKEINLESLTPMQAFDALRAIHTLATSPPRSG